MYPERRRNYIIIDNQLQNDNYTDVDMHVYSHSEIGKFEKIAAKFPQKLVVAALKN